MLDSNIFTCPPEFKAGIEQFNSQQFFQCHETLETFWHKQTSEDRLFTQGIIQIAVGYHHLSNDNRKGAVKLFRAGLNKTSKYLPIYFNIELEQFLSRVSLDLDQLIKALPIEDYPKIFFVNS